MTQPFAPPAEAPTDRVAALYSPLAIAVCTFFFTPLTGCAMAGVNYWRVGEGGKGLGMAVVGVFAVVVAGVAGAILPDGLSTGASIGLTGGAIMALHQDQAKLHQAHPGATPASPLLPVFLGVVFLVGLMLLPTVAWILTGDPAIRPEWMGPRP